jgi:hypothetical protein
MLENNYHKNLPSEKATMMRQLIDSSARKRLETIRSQLSRSSHRRKPAYATCQARSKKRTTFEQTPMPRSQSVSATLFRQLPAEDASNRPPCGLVWQNIHLTSHGDDK